MFTINTSTFSKQRLSMGLITLRPFPHIIAVPLWRYFRANSYKTSTNPGLGIRTTIDDINWDSVNTPTVQTFGGYKAFKVVGFTYLNNKLVIGHSLIDPKSTTNTFSYQSLMWHSYDGITWDQTTVSNSPSVEFVSGSGIRSESFVSVNTPSKAQLVSSTMVSTPNDWKPISHSSDGFNWFELTVS